MLPPWTEEYIGIPYLFRGSSRDGCDCWGLARMILRERFGAELPDFAHEDGDPSHLAAVVAAVLPTIPGLVRVAAPELGDIVLLTLRGEPCHVGVVLDHEYMVHTLRQHDSALDRYDGRWKARQAGFYRVSFHHPTS